MNPVAVTTRHRLLAAAVALTGLTAVAMPGTASANSTANTTILNVVRVDYKDATGANSFAANATTSVTVNLVKAQLNPSGVPTGADGSPGLTCLPSGSFASGTTVSSLYALTATANGQDTYNLAIADNSPSTTANVTGVTRAYSVLDYQGLNPSANPATRVLGSAIPTAVVNATTLEFPGGALAGFAANDIVVVSYGASKKVYLVSSVDAGQAPAHNNLGNVAHTDLDVFSQTETKGQLVLAAYDNYNITLNGSSVTFGGANTAPDFVNTPPTLGVPVGEMILVKVDITASTNTATDGEVGYTLSSTDSSSGNSSTITCTVGKFKAPTLSIKKEARNATTSGSFAATANGNPGQVLEYRVTVANAGGQASQVVVTDAVPAYTTLVTHVGSYGAGGGTGAATNKFASVTDNATNTLDLDVQDLLASEVQPLAPVETGYGKAAGTAAAAAITFSLGDTATNATGGKLPYCSDGSALSGVGTCATGTKIDTLTILYQVKID